MAQTSGQGRAVTTAIAGTGLLAGAGVVIGLRDLLINPVNYAAVDLSSPQTAGGWVIPALVLACAVATAVLLTGAGQMGRAWPVEVTAGSASTSAGPRLALFGAVASLVLSGAWLLGRPAVYPTVVAAILGLCVWIDRSGAWKLRREALGNFERMAPWLLGLAVGAVTIWHAGEQVRYWQHFLLGYADFGFFTTELEHCLPWKEVGPDRFQDTRLGYHAVWMFYLLTPFYAVFRSPVFLMVVGPLVLHLAAIPFYQLARNRTGSAVVGLLVALGWLMLPSITRLPYSNTYGFQSIYLAVPWLAFAFVYGMQGRWAASHICLAGAMLCEETVSGVGFGWGAYLVLFTTRRRDGVIIMGSSLAYLTVMAGLVIPYFATEEEYTRLHLFGDAGLEGLLARFGRARVGWFLLALAAPLAVGLVRCPRLIIAAVPTLVLVLMLQQRDYLNIKYWHQASVLPVLFTAAVVGVTGATRATKDTEGPSGTDGDSGGSRPGIEFDAGPVIALLVGVLLFHFLMGLSPTAQAHRISSADAKLNEPDERLEAVALVRGHFAPEQFVVIATERMAAHFIDYRMVYPAPRARLGARASAPRVLVFDRSDRWDKVVMEEEVDRYLRQAIAAGFKYVDEVGPVVILAEAPAAPSS